MSEDLQSLLEKINRDGVEKAKAAADKIVAEAKANAAEIVATAKAEAEKARAESAKAAEDYARRAAETVRQAERDTLVKIEGAVTGMLERLLVRNVQTALADEKTVAALVAEAIGGLAGPVEVALPAALAPALKARLAAQKSLTVITDETFQTGFAVRLEGGRVEHAFTGEVVAAELAKRLRPDLAALLK